MTTNNQSGAAEACTACGGNNIMCSHCDGMGIEPRKIVGYRDCYCLPSMLCDGKCKPIFADETATTSNSAASGGAEAAGEVPPKQIVPSYQRPGLWLDESGCYYELCATNMRPIATAPAPQAAERKWTVKRMDDLGLVYNEHGEFIGDTYYRTAQVLVDAHNTSLAAQPAAPVSVAEGVPAEGEVQAEEAKLYRDLTGDATAMGYEGLVDALQVLRKLNDQVSDAEGEPGAWPKPGAVDAKLRRRFLAEWYGQPEYGGAWPDHVVHAFTGWMAAQRHAAAPTAGKEAAGVTDGWERLTDETRFKEMRPFDIVLTNGVTLYNQHYNLIDWTQVRDWRYSPAPTLDSAQQAEVCPSCKGQSGGVGADGVENDCHACFVREHEAWLASKAAAPQEQAWQPVMRAGQVKKGDRLRFKIGDNEYHERAKLILHAGTDKEEVIYNKSENFYFITSMVINGRSNHKQVEVLATPSPAVAQDSAHVAEKGGDA